MSRTAIWANKRLRRDIGFSEIKKEQHKAMKELGATDILKAFDSEKDIETRFQTDFQKLLRGKTTLLCSSLPDVGTRNPVLYELGFPQTQQHC